MTTTSPPIEILTAEEVAVILHCSPKTVMEKARNGEIPGAKFSRTWIFKLADIVQYLDDEILRQTKSRKQSIPAANDGPRSFAQPNRKATPRPDLSPYRQYIHK